MLTYYYNAEKARIPLARAERIASYVESRLGPYAKVMKIAGSIRRRKPIVGDIEFVVLPKRMGDFLEEASRMGFSGGLRIQRANIRGAKVELYIAHEKKELGAMMLTYTGNALFNIFMRSAAKKMGYTLNQYGIFTRGKPASVVLQSEWEEDFFDFFGRRYVEPENRNPE